MRGPRSSPRGTRAQALLKDPEKKLKFFKLLKQMRESSHSKSADLTEQQKSANRRAMNGEVQRLLGDEVYQKYRAVRVANMPKKKGGGAPAEAKAKGGGKKGKKKGAGAATA